MMATLHELLADRVQRIREVSELPELVPEILDAAKLSVRFGLSRAAITGLLSGASAPDGPEEALAALALELEEWLLHLEAEVVRPPGHSAEVTLRCGRNMTPHRASILEAWAMNLMKEQPPQGS
jgi:hypothetical protein